MKRTLKIVLPIVIILALLGTGYWFFFRYRTDLTTDFLTNLGDSRLEAGRNEAAVRCYEWARKLSPDDVELSLKLAEAYRQSGNYTKTERTLAKAIAASPEDTSLYVALCSAFVEQDKLLEAQNFLDKRITNEKVAAELAERRPAMPEITPPPKDDYDDYITIELSVGDPEDVCYCTTNGEHPSRKTNAYAGPITLEAGKTVVRAVAVNKEGLVSPALEVQYTVSGVVEEVVFQDSALKQQIQELLNRGDRAILTSDLWGITDLKLPEGVTTLEDLRHFTGLIKLTGWDLGRLDYSVLKEMPSLRYLELDHCELSTDNLQAIFSCPNLDVLILSNSALSNISGLERLTGLRVLDLTGNSISNMGPVAQMTTLDELYLGHNALTSLPDLRSLSSLRVLDLSYNALDGVGALSSCPTLERVNVSHNKLVSVKPLGALPSLVFLDASYNGVLDAGALSACTKLETFLMTDNKLTSIDFLKNIPTIREINIERNDVVSAPQFREDCKLERFCASHNFLEDLSGLGGLQYLTYVDADYNNIRDISVLKDCPILAQVNVYGTYVHDGGVLAENGVVVNFTPSFS